MGSPSGSAGRCSGHVNVSAGNPRSPLVAGDGSGGPVLLGTGTVGLWVAGAAASGVEPDVHADRPATSAKAANNVIVRRTSDLPQSALREAGPIPV
jgi:hypothetical protein